MRYCISARQPISVVKKADEVNLDWKDREYLPQLIVDAPNIKINLEVPNGANVPYKTIQDFIKEGANISLQLENLLNKKECEEYNIPFFQKQYLNDFWSINNAVKNGVSELKIAGSLYFDLEAISNFNVPIRLIANLAVPNNSNFIDEDGIKGTYVRPEDIQYYEQYVKIIEFYSENLKQEETLLKIYKEDQNWPGNLNKLIYNLKTPVDNRGLPEEFGQIRMTCKHRCMRNHTCKFCDTAFLFSKQLDIFTTNN